MSANDQPNDNPNQLPTMGGGKKGGARPGSGRPSSASLQERAEGLDMRDQELIDREAKLIEREAALDSQGIDPNPAPIQPISDGTGKGENPKAVRVAMGKSKRLYADPYIKKYPHAKLMWVNDMNGDVQRWIDAGAEPVPRETQDSRTFEGITDRQDSKWVRAIGGDDGMGGHFWVYLLMMSLERYDEVELAPLRERQEDIKRAMSRGKDQSDGAGGELESYAPHLPTGGQGFEKIQDHIVGR